LSPRAYTHVPSPVVPHTLCPCCRCHRPQGSGFIYHADGYILTNAHVVTGTPAAAAAGPGAAGSSYKVSANSRSTTSSSNSSSSSASVRVHLSDGRVYAGRVVALDAISDVAVVKVEAEGPLPVVQLGDSNRYCRGAVQGAGTPAFCVGSTAAVQQCSTQLGGINRYSVAVGHPSCGGVLF
jgi:hypothetical protein